MVSLSRIIVLSLIWIVCIGLSRTSIGLSTSGPHARDSSASRPTDSEGTLCNLLQPSSRVLTGGEPGEPEDFARLARMGVRTVVSVDGVSPNLGLAAEYGLEYVHIPIGYAGIDRHAQHSLVRLVQDREGPFYIHCHHGRHRGPAAAALACRALGVFDEGDALAFLCQAGTDPQYAGLYRDVKHFEIPPEGTLLPELVSKAEVATMAEQMASIDRIFDRVSDVVSPQDALLLLEGFREAARGLDNTARQQKHLIESMWNAVADCEQLLDAQSDSERNVVLRRISDRCAECHSRFRD